MGFVGSEYFDIGFHLWTSLVKKKYIVWQIVCKNQRVLFHYSENGHLYNSLPLGQMTPRDRKRSVNYNVTLNLFSIQSDDR